MSARLHGALGLGLLGLTVACASGSDNPRDTAAEIGQDTDADESTGTATSAATTMATSPTTSETDGDANCVPGQQIECACPGGSPGAQACLPDGSGFDVCVCPGEDPSTSTTNNTTNEEATADSGSSEGTSVNACDACGLPALDEQCNTQFDACLTDAGCTTMANCVQNCGITPACAQECAGPDDTSSSALLQDLVNCVLEVCPKCARG